LTAALYLGAAAFFGLFVWWQSRATQPLVNLALFKRMPLSAGFITNTLVGGALVEAMVNIPLFTNVILGGSAIEGGLNLMRLTVAPPIALGGGYLSRLGFGPAATIAMVLAGAGSWACRSDGVAGAACAHGAPAGRRPRPGPGHRTD
jgi:hypothetical protein